MRRAAILSLLLVTLAWADVKTGEQELVFTARSPLSTEKILTDRLALRSAGEDDDLAHTHFLCYVPPDAATTGPLGLIVWLNYRATDTLPKSIEPLLDRSHTIFVVAKTANQDAWARAGLAVDAVFNLKQQYSIDDRRVFLFSLLKPDDTLGQQMALAFPDAFAGFVDCLNLRYFRSITANGVTYAASFAKPAASPLIGQAKLRRHLLVGDLHLSDTNHLVQKAYWQDGFADTQLMETQPTSITYPHLDPAFFTKILDALAVAAPSASQPTSRAAEPITTDDEPTRTLNLAKNLIAAGRNDAARGKLRELLTQFPQDPSATEAQRLLSDLAKR